MILGNGSDRDPLLVKSTVRFITTDFYGCNCELTDTLCP